MPLDAIERVIRYSAERVAESGSSITLDDASQQAKTDKTDDDDMADLRAATDAVCFGQGGQRSRRADIGRNRVEAGCLGQPRSLALRFPHHVVPTSVHRCRHRVRAHRERLSGQPATSRRRDGTALGRVRARDWEVRRMPHAARLGCQTSDVVILDDENGARRRW